MGAQERYFLIKREYVIGRLIGYLENYRYLQKVPQICGKQENILYLYGDIDRNEHFYANLREDIGNTGRQILYYSFAEGDGTLGVQSFLQEIIAKNKEYDFTYTGYYLELLAAAEEYAEDHRQTVNWGDVARFGLKLINPDPFTRAELAIDLTEKAVGLLKYLADKVKAPRKEDVSEEEETRDVSDIATPFLFLKYDLEQISREHPEKQFVFLINGIETYEEKIRPSVREDYHMDIEQWMDMMAETDTVVWILLNKQMPDAKIRRKIDVEYIWQIGCLNREEALQYLRAEMPEEQEEWIRKVYEETGGQLKLMDYCMECRRAEKKDGRNFPGGKTGIAEEIQKYKKRIDVFRKMLAGMDEEEEQREMDNQIRELQEKIDTLEYKSVFLSQDELSQWFQSLWKGKLTQHGKTGEEIADYIPKITREDPLWKIFPDVVLAYWTEGCQFDPKDKMLLPCICYLIWNKEQTQNADWLLGINTNNQYGTEKKENIIRVIYEAKCFAEYREYENTYYVREEIAGILKQHQNFERWSKLFRDTYVEELLPKNSELAEKITLNDNNDIGMSQMHNAKILDKDMGEGPGIAENEHSFDQLKPTDKPLEKTVEKGILEEKKPEESSASEQPPMINEAKIKQDISEKNESHTDPANQLDVAASQKNVDKNIPLIDNDNYNDAKKI